MRIAIDARMMGPLVTRGIGRYVEELIRSMIAASSHAFVLFMRHPETSPFLGHPLVEHIKADIPWYGWREQVELPRIFARARFDLLHVPHWNVPFLYQGPVVATVHDLILWHQPESAKSSTRSPFVRSLKRLGFQRTLERTIRRSHRLLVPTQYVAQDIIRSFAVSPERIVVTGEGLTDFPTPDTSRIPASPFLFYVGSAYPHKRLDVLLSAWKTISAQHPDLHLILAGEEDVFMARHVARVREEKLERVRFTGRVSDAELAGFLSQAQAFVFPSSDEGFGLPPLEALSFGCPVISSDSSCLPEVLPVEGVWFFRDGDKDDMIRALEHVLRDPLQARLQAQAGRVKARQRHRWEVAASRTLTVYEHVLYPFHDSHRSLT